MSAAALATTRAYSPRGSERHGSLADKDHLSALAHPNLDLLYGGMRGKTGRDQPFDAGTAAAPGAACGRMSHC